MCYNCINCKQLVYLLNEIKLVITTCIMENKCNQKKLQHADSII